MDETGMTLEACAVAVKEELQRQGLTVATCESLTCGMIAATLGGVPGVSTVLAGGLVTYMTEQKHRLADVSEETLRDFGAVSEQTAREMALGAAVRLGTDCAVSATGNAGPSAMEGKPAGLVFVGACVCGEVVVRELRLSGDRTTVREGAAHGALQLLLEQLRSRGQA